MTPFVVIEDLQVVEDGSPSFGFGIEATIFREALPFEAREEALVGSIVIAIAFRTHALRQAIESYELSEFFAGVLITKDTTVTARTFFNDLWSAPVRSKITIKR